MLKMIVIPLIFPKLILAVCSLDRKLSGKIGGWLLILVFVLNLVTEVIAVVVCLLLRPGGKITYFSLLY